MYKSIKLMIGSMYTIHILLLYYDITNSFYFLGTMWLEYVYIPIKVNKCFIAYEKEIKMKCSHLTSLGSDLHI